MVGRMWTMYFLKSKKKKWYYVGSTNCLYERVKEHNNGKVVSTKNYIPLHLVYTEEYSSEHEARDREQLIKHKRIEKEKIVREIENNCRIV